MEASAMKRRRLDAPIFGKVLDNAETSKNLDERSFHRALALPESEKSHQRMPRKSQMLPTTLDSLGEAANASMFKLQVDELLTRIRHEHERQAARIEATLRQLKGIIDRLPSQEAKPVAEAEQQLKKLYGVRVPFSGPRPSKDTKYSVAYANPADVSIVGSYSRKTAVRAEEYLSVDMAVTMPSQIFQDKDYQNYRYFHKRAFYLAYLASGIQCAADGEFIIKYAYQNDNELQPILLITPLSQPMEDRTSRSKYQIRILLAASQDLFPVAKILPSKSSIRSKSMEGSSFEGLTPTPFYNATLRSECCTLSFSKMLQAASTQSEAFKEACILGSVWLRQRGLGTGLRNGGFGPFEWACLLALLMQGGGLRGKPLLSKAYNQVQLFRAALHFLDTRDLMANPLTLHASDLDVAAFKGPVVFDGSRGVNLLFKMTSWSYQMLRHEAGVGLRTMNAVLAEPFVSLFIRLVDEPLQRFDSVLSLHIPESYDAPREADALDPSSRFCQRVYDALIRGLSDRVSLVYCYCLKTVPWSIDSMTPPEGKGFTANVGLTFNAEQAFRVVDHGPSNEDQAAAAQYRQFWGEKAELRRFRDGRLLETLIWAQDPNESVVKQIVTYVIQRHCGQDIARSLHVSSEIFHSFIADPGPANPASGIMSAFEKLEQDIRRLEGLPLQIRQVTAASPHLRYASLTDAVVAKSTTKSQSTQPVNVCVQFEGSARWPNDISAIQRTKIAFLYKIGELLESSSTEGMTARVGLEHRSAKLLNTAFLDLVYPRKAIFRVRIHHERELNLLEGGLSDKTLDFNSREDVVSAIAVHKRAFIQGPLHTQAVRTLCTRFPLLSPSMRLMKKWRDSHLLSGHISDELVELIVIHTFVTPYPWRAPGSLATAVLRTLTFISKWQWQTEPLIVDFSQDMSCQDVHEITLRFEAWRKIDPAMNRVVMFAASNLDRDGTSWTAQGPAKVVAARFTSLARAACQLCRNQDLDVQPKGLFTASIADYDFLIHLKPKFTTNRDRTKQQKLSFKNLQFQHGEALTDSTVAPINLYIEELRTLFGSNIIFFHNELGGTFIGGLWNPRTGQRTWRTHVAYSTSPLLRDEGEYIALNQKATLHDIARLGGDMVLKIEVK